MKVVYKDKVYNYNKSALVDSLSNWIIKLEKVPF